MTCNYIKALDLVRDGHWDDSHEMVQACTDPLSFLIHAYLHRIEGDFENANFWYQRAGEDMRPNSLADELSRLYALAKAV